MAAKVKIIRGVPGSGKSRLAQEIAVADENTIIVSADHFFETDDGEYNFDKYKLGQAQAECMARFIDALVRGYDVVVDNTNSRIWEFENYISIAQTIKPAVKVEIFEIETPNIEAVRIFAKRNTHGVPASVILNMWYRWENVPARLVLPITWKTPNLKVPT